MRNNTPGMSLLQGVVEVRPSVQHECWWPVLHKSWLTKKKKRAPDHLWNLWKTNNQYGSTLVPPTN